MSTRRPGADASGVLAPVTLRSAADTVADRLVTAIALGQFMVGERLPAERDLAALLEVSRTTVRDAVHQLAEAGYVRVQRGRNGGTFVESVWGQDAEAMIRRTLAPDWARLEQLLDFRTIIEGEIARTAAARRTAQDVEALRAAVHAYAEAGPDRASSSAADQRLHQTIAAATANRHLVQLSLRIRREVSLGIGADPWSPQLRERALRQHPELVHAVIEGDVVRAGLLAAEHFSLTEQTIRDLLAAVHATTPAHDRARPPVPIEGAHAHRHA